MQLGLLDRPTCQSSTGTAASTCRCGTRRTQLGIRTWHWGRISPGQPVIEGAVSGRPRPGRGGPPPHRRVVVVVGETDMVNRTHGRWKGHSCSHRLVDAVPKAGQRSRSRRRRTDFSRGRRTVVGNARLLRYDTPAERMQPSVLGGVTTAAAGVDRLSRAPSTTADQWANQRPMCTGMGHVAP